MAILLACNYYTWLMVALLVLVLLCVMFEMHYFFRTLYCLISSRVFKKYVHVLDTTSYSSACITTDVDFLLFHMNNSRYLREVDFARNEFYLRTGLWKAIRDKGGLPVQGGANIRYRRFIRTFTMYKIESRIVYWDDNSIFMEHRFVSGGDDFVNAIVHCRNRVINCNVNQLMDELIAEGAKKYPGTVEAMPRTKPECPLEIDLWNQSNLVSSENLRNSNC